MENLPVVEIAAADGKDKKASKSSAKKRGAMNLLRVALYMLRRRSNRKAGGLPIQVTSRKGFWKNLMAAVRPMDLEDRPRQLLTAGESPVPLQIEAPNDLQAPLSLESPLHPRCSSSSSSVDAMSRYASAQDLKQLDDSEDEEDVHGDGDEAIDILAEKFIANFYEQIRLQRLESVNNRFDESKNEEISATTAS
ncbi:uncharacterized protein [Aristolochia californica]|uniref:uncharacterized protein n=1 Tax=Aristolochia californica TaxID=171875 RepID=UPI0035D5FF9A